MKTKINKDSKLYLIVSSVLALVGYIRMIDTYHNVLESSITYNQ